jgi:hypothetical protein
MVTDKPTSTQGAGSPVTLVLAAKLLIPVMQEMLPGSLNPTSNSRPSIIVKT